MFVDTFKLCLQTHVYCVINHDVGAELDHEISQAKEFQRVFKGSNKRQKHLNVGSTNTIRLKPNLTPILEFRALVRLIIHAHLCGQGGPSEALGSCT